MSEICKSFQLMWTNSTHVIAIRYTVHNYMTITLHLYDMGLYLWIFPQHMHIRSWGNIHQMQKCPASHKFIKPPIYTRTLVWLIGTSRDWLMEGTHLTAVQYIKLQINWSPDHRTPISDSAQDSLSSAVRLSSAVMYTKRRCGRS